MRINLEEAEIQTALVGYIENQGIDLSHKTVTVALVAGRGIKGHKALIEILPTEDTTKNADNSAEIPDTGEAELAIPFD